MKEQFDKTLRNHIKDTFGSYHDQYADDGWNKLVNKKRRKRRGLIFWYTLPGGIAAALAIIWLYNWNTLTNTTYLTNKATIAKTEIVIEKPNKVDNLSQIERPFKNSNIDLNVIAVSKNKSKNLFGYQSKQAVKKTIKPTLIEQGNSSENQLDLADDDRLLLSIINNRISTNDVNEKLKPESKVNAKNLILETAEANLVNDDNYVVRTTEIEIPQQNVGIGSRKIPSKVLAVNTPLISTKNNLVKKSKFNLAVDANTYYSFSERGVNDQVNLGFGIATTYKLGKNLSLNSGILLNQQTSSFEGLDNASFSNRLAVNSAFAVVPNAQITNAKLVGLDIPLNIQYSFKMGKAKTFITTGFSSYSVINEEYINDYSVTNYFFTGVNTSNITTVQDNPAGSFTYFRFARTLNFSFGLQYPLSNKNSLSVEPFVKYPIAGFGYEDLLIGSGGLSLKYNFSK